MIPPSWELGGFGALKKASGPVQLWRKFTDGVAIQDILREAIGKELQSSYDWQRMFRAFVLIRYEPTIPQSGVFSISSPLSYTEIIPHRMGAKYRSWSPYPSGEP